MPRPAKHQKEADQLKALLALFTRTNRHTFLKPGNGQLGRMQKDFYMIPAELVDEVIHGN